jgi:aerobic-type carbon monoxide dehydrogenase small subunit (CoxS/CutS family)
MTDAAVESRQVTVRVNGTAFTSTVPVRLTLADFLRDHLDLVSVHLGCEHGVCGCCTVLLDGRSVRSCLMFAVQADGRAIETVENLSADPEHLHPLQEAFTEEHGLQCGFCTPALILRTKELIASDAASTAAELREELSGILCRCTGYQNVVRAVQTAMNKVSG